MPPARLPITLTINGAEYPLHARTAARALVGGEPSERLFAHVAEAALADARPLAHNGYKLPLAKALVRRALEILVEGTGGAA